MEIDLKLKTYEQLQNEIITLNTNSYLKDLKIEQLQSNWNSLREWLKEYSQDLEFRCYMDMVLDKMNELEGDNNGIMDKKSR